MNDEEKYSRRNRKRLDIHSIFKENFLLIVHMKREVKHFSKNEVYAH